ncbi:GPCR fungal pheromone mating factor [Cyathus striatus]|nr:GPCR fungal pheromone mating factor [Cyathus striatus]
MSAELSVLSFLLAVLLAAYIPIKRVRNNVANLAVVLWLVVCNLIHGINAIQWAGNVDMSSPGWCDIATRISLAFYIALPAACICMSRELESKSSQRIISKDIRSVRIRALIDILICYVLPMLYLILHYVVQSHRFDIIKGYGCFASIHPSGPALLIITLTPTLLCSISLVFSGAYPAIHDLLLSN